MTRIAAAAKRKSRYCRWMTNRYRGSIVMANAAYNIARKLFLQKGIDWATDTIKIALVDTSGAAFNYAFDAAHQYLADVPAAAIRGTASVLNKSVTPQGAADADDVVFAGVPVGPPVEALVMYKDTGHPATSPLLYYMDTGTGLPITPPGVSLTLVWDGGINRIFRP